MPRKNRRWTDEEIDMILSRKYTPREISEITGRRVENVRAKFVTLKIPMHKYPLYSMMDLNTEETIFVGNIHELCKFSGKTRNAIDSAICHAKKRGTRCRYAVVGYEDDE